MNNLLVYNLLKSAAQKWPENPAIHDEYGTLTFNSLEIEVETLKLELITLGVKSGMGVGVMARNSRNFIISVFAILGCGAAVMPVSHQLKQTEIDEILDKTKLHAILDDYSGIKPLEIISKEIPLNIGRMRFAYTNIDSSHVFASHVNAPAFIRYTSGTTGVSKGVVISNQSVLERTAAANKSLQLNEQSNVVWVLPMAYHFVVSIVLYIRFGSSISIVKSFMAQSVLEITNQYNGTMLYASPMQIRLLAADRSEAMMPSLTKVISTSAGISADISQAFQKRYNQIVHQAFGIIEIGLPIVNTDISEEYLDAVGYALPDFDVQVFDKNNKVLPSGETGVLGIKGPGMFDAYLDPPVMRNDLLIDGYFYTADFATISNEGMIKIEGRKKSMINIAGNKVFAEEVEHVLEELPYIEMARVSGVPHPLMGQIIQAEVVVNELEMLDVETVLSFCRERLSTFKIPQKLLVVDSLPMTKTGKIQRH
ncbi:MAG: acyl--CoA ligase [Crocinitomicaceae bacterium]|nr:acyl--CoA ligase [Crocinitomicaceae bacterium]